ncbi:molybdopterin oxidoreductase family protein [Paeniglutamicibacter psychrophenolicus]|uniref:molybdopterin oxidoreductase family protein n=1 Tax=Paeniglutamicibacter psychrophenolicus TaxID=257454 RepID=UPI002782A185|nr:molybdopterin oxidoreductase family protein [Paeniglutamicibacter psychrophenolicus]MDQ0093281.1 assimilatory nitrate reductase catalytic subunit [Paeniglutamicibacter psychrophenolicus]
MASSAVDTRTTPTHCPYCALQCGISLDPGPGVEAREPVLLAGRDFETNGGALCRKGYSAGNLLNHPERLRTPLRRAEDGSFEPIGWDEALDMLAQRAADIRREHGADAVAVFGAGGLTNEKAYQLGKFARLALGTSRIDYNGRFCMSSAAAAGNRAFGLDRGLPFPLADLDAASMILMLGSNVAETMPPFVRHLEHARACGGLIVVDPRRSPTAGLCADGSGRHLQPTPGTDLQLLLGLAHVLLAENLVDDRYLAKRTNGLPGLRASVAGWWPERVAAATGVPATEIRRTARALAATADAAKGGGGGVFILTGRGVEQHANGTDTTTAAINIALLLGLPGTLGGGFGTITGQGNGQGGREHGQKADQLPGYRKITDPADRAHVAKVWGVDPETIPGPGIPATELLHTLGTESGARMLMVHGSNPVLSSPDASKVLAGLRRLDFLVVCDFFLSETAAEADLVLPVLQWAEEEGTMTNLEGRVLRRRKALEAPTGTRGELWILAELARRLESPGTFSADAREVFEELRLASAGGLADYSGVDWDDLDAGAAVYWPCSTEHAVSRIPGQRSGTPRLFLDGFAHPDARARFVPVFPGTSGEPLHTAGQLALVTGRLLEHYQSGTQTRRVAELAGAAPGARLEIHPATARAHGIAEGQRVAVRNGRGEVVARASLTTAVRLDTVFLPFHFAGEQNANLLTDSAVDPVSAMPAFKNASVSLHALGDES